MVQLKKSRHALKQAKREAKLKEQESEQAAHEHKSKKKKVTLYTTLSVIALIVVFSLIFFFLKQVNTPGPYDSFAQCLTAADATMYGAFWCPHCAEQKKLFEKSFKYVDYVECDAKGKNPQVELCTQKGIRSYPTWIIKGEHHSGLQSLRRLADLTACTLG